MMQLSEAEKLFSQGRYLEVRVAIEPIVQQTDEIRWKQLYALALTKLGAPGVAEKFFRSVYEAASADSENAGIMGSICKELFRTTRDQKYAVQSRDIYHANFVATGNYYPGINAASMCLITGKSTLGREIAQQLVEKLGPAPADFWETVTLAEAKLVLRKTSEATDLYIAGRKIAAQDWGKVSSVYQQLWLLNHYYPVPKSVLKLFGPPNVGVFVGHMVDKADGQVRFPNSIAPQIKEALRGVLKTLDIQIGYSSLACGGDILFAELISEANGEINLYLPFPRADFLSTSVNHGGQDWINRFEALEEKWPIRYLTEEPYHGNNDIFAFHGRSLLGAALLRGRIGHIEPYLITVLSEADTQIIEGGTRDLIKLWPFPKHYQNVDPNQIVPTQRHHRTPSYEAESPWRMLYWCGIDFPTLTSTAEWTKVVERVTPDFADELKWHDIQGGKVWLGLTTSHAAIRVAQELMEHYYSLTRRRDYKTVFHAGVVDQATWQGGDAGTAHALMKYALTDTLLCSHSFATSLVLDPGDYTFTNAGSVVTGPGVSCDVFTIEINQR